MATKIYDRYSNVTWYKCICTETTTVIDMHRECIIYKDLIYKVRKGTKDDAVVSGRVGGYYPNGDEYSTAEEIFVPKELCRKIFQYI